MSVNYELQLLKDKIEQTSRKSEGQIHKDLKYWIAKRYLENGTNIDKIQFEYRYAIDSYAYTISDVSIIENGHTVIYCETKLDWQWLYKFIGKNLPILKEYTSKQIIVFPKNVGALYPHRNNKEFYDEIRENNVEVSFSNIRLKNIPKIVNVELTSDEYDLLKDILGHVNYDDEEVDLFKSLCKKIIKS